MTEKEVAKTVTLPTKKQITYEARGCLNFNDHHESVEKYESMAIAIVFMTSGPPITK